MKPRRVLARAVSAVLIGAAPVPFLALPGSATASAAAVSSAVCGSSSHPALAAKLTADIRAARRGRASAVAVAAYDPGLGLGCWLSSTVHFDSASVVKVTILGALLRKAEDQGRYLTRTEAALATAMITRSDNDAASALWAELGRRYLQHFLKLAQMTHTALGPGGYWGLTQVTAYDEMRLLQLLLNQNPVLTATSRSYALGLMAHVTPSQRWGIPAGAPASRTVHVKNGWLPRASHGWRVHSIGCFTGRGGDYSIVVLTQDNPSMAYGIATIQAIARVINRDLNPGTKAAAAPVPPPSTGTPDETVPALSSLP